MPIGLITLRRVRLLAARYVVFGLLAIATFGINVIASSPATAQSLTNTFNIQDNASLELDAAHSVATAVVGGITYLFVAGDADDGVSVFSVGNDGTLINVFNVQDNATLNLDAAVTVATAVVGGTTYLFVAGYTDDGVSVFSVGNDGSLTNVFNVKDNATLELDGARHLTIAAVNGTTYLFVVSQIDDGLSAFSVGNDGSLTNVFNVQDNATLELDGAYWVASEMVGGTHYLFVAGYDDSGVSVFSVGNDGTLVNVFNVQDDATLELFFASSLSTAVLGGTTYLFVTAWADSGVSAFSVGEDGTLTNVANVTDDATLKLSGARSSTVAVVGNATYYFAAGHTDDGISMFSVGQDGGLTNVFNVQDDGTLELNGVRSLASAEVGGTTYVFAAGEVDDGISVFSVTPDATAPRIASIERQIPTAAGTAADQVTWRVTFDEAVSYTPARAALPFALTNTDNVTDNATLELDGARHVTTAVVNGTTYLFSAGDIDDGISVFSVANNGTLTNVFNVTDSGALELDGAYGLATAVVNSTTYLFAVGYQDDGISVFSVANNGALTNVQNVPWNPSLELDGAAVVTTAVVSGTTYVFVAGTVDDGISVFSVANNGTLTHAYSVTDSSNANLKLDGVAGLTTAVVNGTTYLFAPGTNEDGISVFSVAANGALTNVFNISDNATLNLDNPHTIASAVLGGITYIYVSGYHDNGISVFSVANNGALTNVYNVSDNATLNLYRASTISTAVVAGTTYLFVPGAADNGVSVFSLANDGSMANVANVKDSATLELLVANSVTTGVVNGTTYLFVTGNEDDGISVFSVNPAVTEVVNFTLAGTTASLTEATQSATAIDVTASGGDLAGLNATITLSLAAGQTFADLAGNALSNTTPTGANNATFNIDNTAPTVAITGPAGPVSGAFTATVTFSESVTGFVVGDITVGNGAASDFAGSGTTYTATITPAGDGAVTVDVAQGVAADAAGNTNTAATQFSVTNDEAAPTVAITGPAGPVSGAFTATVTFSESVTGFVVGDLTVGNGAASNFAGSGTTYTATITPAGDGAVTVDVAQGVAADAAGNTNTAAPQFSVTNDETVPTVAITGPAGPVTGAFTATFTFSENVTGFDVDDIDVTNGAASDFAGSGTTYTATITPTADGAVNVDVDAGVAADSTGNTNTAATQFSVTNDETAPTVFITGPEGPVSGAFTATFLFSEDVTGFTLDGISVGNGSPSNLVGSGAAYTATITPSADSWVSLNVDAGAAVDAAGHGNVASTGQYNVINDQTAPMVAITGPAGPVAGAFTATVTFSEDVTGFEVADINVSNGAASSFAGSGTTYTATITPAGNGPVILNVAGGVAQDNAGNANTAAPQFTYTPDETAPTVAITGPAGPVSGAFTATVTFSESVTGFEAGDIGVTNGAASDFAGSGSTYTATITPVGSGLVTLDVNAAVAQDGVGNDNVAAPQFTVTADLVAPRIASIDRHIPTSADTSADSVTWRVTFDEPVTATSPFGLTNVASIGDDATLEIGGAAVVTTAIVNGTTYLFAGGLFDGGISVFSVGNDGALSNVFNIIDDDTLKLSGIFALSTANVSGTNYLFAAGAFDDGVSVFAVAEDGSLTNVDNVTDDATLNLLSVYSVTTAEVSGTTYLFAASVDDGGISVFSVASNGTLTNVFNLSDDATLNLGGPYSVTTAVVSGTTYLFAAGAFDSGISVFSVADNGALTNVANVSDDDTLQIADAATATTAVVNGTTYLFAGGLSDSGISIFSVGDDGALTNVANVEYDASLNLAGLFALSTAQVKGTTYLFAAGAFDDGVSVFSVANDGALTNVLNISDDDALYLSGVYSVATSIVDGTAFLFATGLFDGGFSAFSVDPARGAPDNFAIAGSTASLTASVESPTVIDLTASGGDLASLDGTITLGLRADQVFADLAGNALSSTTPTGANNATFNIDNAAPTVTISGPAGPVSGAFTATFNFSEDVTDFGVGDITVSNGAASDFSGSGTIYSATITPTGDGDLTIDVAGGAAQDEAGNDSAAAAQYSVTVSPAAPDNSDPVAEDDVLEFYASDAARDVTEDVLANDSDPDEGDAAQLVITAVQSADTRGTISLVDGALSYDPAGAFVTYVDGETIEESFSYTISDPDGATDSATVTVTVYGENDPPVANDDAIEFGANETVRDVTAELLANDSDPDSSGESAEFAVSDIDTTGTRGRVTRNGGVVRYDPNGAFDDLRIGDTATDSFGYTISDGHEAAATATVTVTINGDIITPANDNFANAITLSDLEGEYAFTNIGATREAGEPDHAVPGARSVWWQWTPDRNVPIRIQIRNSDFDTTLAIYTGHAVDALTLVASNDDYIGGDITSRVEFSAIAGTTYHIAVDGEGGQSGTAELAFVSLYTPPVAVDDVFAGDVTPVGDDFVVNTTTEGRQESPWVAALAGGGFVIAWNDTSETGDDLSLEAIRAQRFGADGTSQGAEFLVNTTSLNVQMEPRIAALADGGFVIVWTDESETGDDNSGSAIRAQRYGVDGLPAGGEFLVNTTTLDDQAEPGIAPLPGGGFVIAWTDYSSTDDDNLASDIRGQRYGSDGTPDGSEFRVNSGTPGQHLEPSIVALSDGGFVIAWINNHEYSDENILARRFGPDGAVAGPEFQVNASTQGNQYSPRGTALDGGGFVMTWQNHAEVAGTFIFPFRGQRFGPDGSPVGAEFDVNTGAQEGLHSQTVAGLAGGGFVIAWRHQVDADGDTSNGSARAQRYGPDGRAAGKIFQLHSTTLFAQEAPQIAGLPDGGFIVVFTDSSAGHKDIRARRFTPPAALRADATHLLDVLYNDSDADGDSLTITHVDGVTIAESGSVGLASGASVTLSGGMLVYDPTAAPFALALSAGATGDDVFTYTISDGTQSDSADVTVTLARPTNQAPTLVSIVRAIPLSGRTNADSLTWTVSFLEGVQNVSAADFSPTASSATVTGVTPISSSTYAVTVSGGDLADFDGIVGLGLAEGQDIADLAGNALIDTTPTGANETYELDNSAPTVAITGPAGPVSGAFTATFTFSEDVTGFGVGDITVGNGAASNFAGSGTTYTATITPAADGAVTVDLAQAVAADAAGNTNTAAPQLSVTNDEAAPTVSSIVRQTPAVSPTDADILVWRVTFSESIANADIADFLVSGTTGTVTDVAAIDGATHDVTVSGGDLADLNGTVTLSFSAGQDIVDAAGNGLDNVTPTGTNETAWIIINDVGAPRVTSIVRSSPGTVVTNADSLTWTVNFSERVKNVGPDDFAVSGTTATITSVSPRSVPVPPSLTGDRSSSPLVVSSSTFDVTASGGDLAVYDGIVALSISASQDIVDDAGNALTNTTPTGANDNSYALDNTAPTLALSTTATAPVSGPFLLTVTFSEDVTGFEIGDLSVTNGTASDFSAQSASVYSALITPDSGPSVAVDVTAAAAADAVGNDSVAAARFTIAHNPDRMLAVSLAGVGSGTVSSTPAGISCGSVCSLGYSVGTSVTLTAEADAGSNFAGWTSGPCAGSRTATCTVAMTANTAVSARFRLDTPPPGRIVASTLPAARSGYVGGPAISAFLSVVSRTTSPAQSCAVTAPAGAPATLAYRQVDATGAAVGPEDPLFDIVPGGVLNFVIAMTPTAQTVTGGYNFMPVIDCENASLDPIVGVNSVFLTIGAAPVPDILSISATPSGDGVIRIPGPGRVGFMTAAALNIGVGDGSGGARDVRLTVTADTGAVVLPVAIEICPIDLVRAACLTPRAASVTVAMSGSTPAFFAVFVRDTSTGGIAFDPANARVFLRFADATGTPRSATSAAVTAPASSDLPAVQADNLPAGRWSILVRQPDGIWPGLARASLFVTESGLAILDNGMSVRAFSVDRLHTDAPEIGRFYARSHDGQWTRDGQIRLGAPWAITTGEFWGVRDARSDAQTPVADLAGNYGLSDGSYGQTITVSASGAISGGVGGCIVSGNVSDRSGTGPVYASLTLMGCSVAGSYGAVFDIPANDAGPVGLLIGGAHQGWRLRR